MKDTVKALLTRRMVGYYLLTLIAFVRPEQLQLMLVAYGVLAGVSAVGEIKGKKSE